LLLIEVPPPRSFILTSAPLQTFHTTPKNSLQPFHISTTVSQSITMINFGVREVANTKSISAPGWAYVPDTGVNASVAALQPSSRKRARGITSATLHETTAKQDAKIVRELAALDRENHRDVSIPVPIRHRDNAGRGSSQLMHISVKEGMKN